MQAPAFLSGTLAGWAVTQVALGAYFVVAFALRRREFEYILFGLLCFAMAVVSGGLSWSYIGGDAAWQSAMALLHAGVILAPALNLHFAMRYAEVRPARWVLPVVYGAAILFEIANLFGLWWSTPKPHAVPAAFLGFSTQRLAGDPTLPASTFYVIGALELMMGLGLLLYAYRHGKREALPAFLGGALVGVCSINDLLLALGCSDSFLLLPHVFWAYALPVAATLLVRYRTAAGELELTESYLRLKTEQLRHSHAELRLVHDELERKEQLAAVGELAAAIAHEVRNPLAIIINAAAGLRRAELTEKDHGTLLDIIEEETARLNRLVTDLLRFARPVSVVRANVSVDELAQKARSFASEEHPVVVEVAPSPWLGSVWADPGLLWLVLDNVVSNAIQAMPEGGTTRIRVGPGELNGGPSVRIEVRDTGHGMDEKVLSRAMDPFFTTRPSGTGLGLSIVQRIMEAHGGRVALASRPGEGTTVTLTLPAGQAQVASQPARTDDPAG